MNSDFNFMDKFADRKYVAKLKAALGSIMSLASENMLDERDADSPELKAIVKEQGEDMHLVQEFYEVL